MGSPKTLGELRAAAGLTASAAAKLRGVSLQAERKTERQAIEVTGLGTVLAFLGHLGVTLEVSGSGIKVIPEDHPKGQGLKVIPEGHPNGKKPQGQDLASLVRAALKDAEEVDHFSHEIFRLDLKTALEMYGRTKRKPDPRRLWDPFYGTSEAVSIKEACEYLDVPVPKKGQPVDPKALLKGRNNKARAYHPDRTGNDKTAGLFQLAMDSYQVLVKYNAGLGT